MKVGSKCITAGLGGGSAPMDGPWKTRTLCAENSDTGWEPGP